MVTDLNSVGKGWLIGKASGITTEIEELTPAEVCEKYRWIPARLTSVPGPMSFDLNPYMREIINNADINSPINEVNVKKGVQITWTVSVLESIVFYYVIHVKNTGLMFVSADFEMALSRFNANMIPMFNESGYTNIIQSSDPKSRRTGKNKERIEFQGGCFIIPVGAVSAKKMRQWSVKVLLKDEISGWDYEVGKDGNPDKLTDARVNAYKQSGYKIFRGSTPTEYPDHIEDNYLRGDQRKYFVPCLNSKCGHMQFLEWKGENKDATEENGKPKQYGIHWELTEDGSLDRESVCYVCKECGHKHYEHDKRRMFAEESGAEWRPTAVPVADNIRSYHLPGLYSPVGFESWANLVMQRLDCNDELGNVKDYNALKTWFNNCLGEPWENRGGKIPAHIVWEHKRTCYRFGEIPNKYAITHSGSRILFLTCTVDVQKMFLSVAVFGWTVGAKSYLIDYFDIKADSENDTCDDIGSSVWETLDDFIQHKTYTADDGTEYGICITAVDARWGDSTSTVQQFCAGFTGGVFPLMGKNRPDNVTKIVGWTEGKTDYGTKQFMIVVDHYKDRLAPVLRREWIPADKPMQDEWHFNAPVDIKKKHVKELTSEYKREKKLAKGKTAFEWYRPNGARNELWDLLVYAHAMVEIRAWYDCTNDLGLEEIDWNEFWTYRESFLTPLAK